jgi:hypothetical protein
MAACSLRAVRLDVRLVSPVAAFASMPATLALLLAPVAVSSTVRADARSAWPSPATRSHERAECLRWQTGEESEHRLVVVPRPGVRVIAAAPALDSRLGPSVSGGATVGGRAHSTATCSLLVHTVSECTCACGPMRPTPFAPPSRVHAASGLRAHGRLEASEPRDVVVVAGTTTRVRDRKHGLGLQRAGEPTCGRVGVLPCLDVDFQPFVLDSWVASADLRCDARRDSVARHHVGGPAGVAESARDNAAPARVSIMAPRGIVQSPDGHVPWPLARRDSRQK